MTNIENCIAKNVKQKTNENVNQKIKQFFYTLSDILPEINKSSFVYNTYTYAYYYVSDIIYNIMADRVARAPCTSSVRCHPRLSFRVIYMYVCTFV